MDPLGAVSTVYDADYDLKQWAWVGPAIFTSDDEFLTSYRVFAAERSGMSVSGMTGSAFSRTQYRSN